MAAVVIIRPERDGLERELSRWADPFIARLNDRPTTAAVDLRGSGATRQAVEKELGPDKLIVYWGHGDRVSLGQPIPLIDEDNIRACRGSIIVAIACYSAAELGRLAVRPEVGVAAYLGYERKLPVPKDPHNIGYLAAGALEIISRGRSIRAALGVLNLSLDKFVSDSLAAPVQHGAAPRVPEWLIAVSLRDGLKVLPEVAGVRASLESDAGDTI